MSLQLLPIHAVLTLVVRQYEVNSILNFFLPDGEKKRLTRAFISETPLRPNASDRSVIVAAVVQGRGVEIAYRNLGEVFTLEFGPISDHSFIR